MGSDFGYRRPDLWFKNMDDAIELVRRLHLLCFQAVIDENGLHTNI